MRTVLVLGTGQVGTFVARALAEADAAVVAGDLEPALGFFRRFGTDAADLVSVDVLDEDAVGGLIRARGADVVVLAAGVPAADCRRDPERGWNVNALGPAVVAGAALAAGASRLVYLSSVAVYGPGTGRPLHETSAFAPHSLYGRSKVAGETAMFKASVRGLEVRIIRPTGIYGPRRAGSGSQSAKLIDRLLLAGLAGGAVAARPANVGVDEYLYVKDLARAVSRLALADGLPRADCFNVGCGSLTQPDELRRAVERVIPGSRIAIRADGTAARRSPLDVRRIRSVIGFEPIYGLDDGLSDYVATAVMS